MRESSAAEGVLNLVAMLLFLLAAGALVILVRRAGRFGTAGKAGAAFTSGGVLVLVLANLVQALVFGGDFALMPYFVIPGVAALIIGFALLAVTVLRSGVLPRRAAWALLAGTLTMLGSNEQTERAWLAIPFGVAWIAVGYALYCEASRQTSAVQRGQRHRVTPQ